MNRLHLDFKLNTLKERTDFINEYLSSLTFSLTAKEKETISDYILWGKDDNGDNIDSIELSTAWTSKQPESLEALLDSPTFKETQFTDIHPKVVKEKINRAHIRATAPAAVVSAFEDLWSSIDRIELTLNFYDILHNKRSKPPRDELLARVSDQDSIQKTASLLTQQRYLKLKHLLKELREEQYAYKDLYCSTIQLFDQEHFSSSSSPTFGQEIRVLPLGLKYEGSSCIFPDQGMPYDLSENDYNLVYNALWHNNENATRTFDFRNLEDVYNLLLLFEEVESASEDCSVESTLPELIATFDFYCQNADLTPLQREILNLKIHHFKNQQIADYINTTYNKTYNANYISTLFRQKIIVSINNAATLHREVMENIFYPENFQKCRCCGKTLLLHEYNFVRKHNSKTGFTTRCKQCDKENRNKKKENKDE